MKTSSLLNLKLARFFKFVFYTENMTKVFDFINSGSCDSDERRFSIRPA